MENTSPLPLHACRVMKPEMIINRLHMLLHGIAILFLFYYRATTLFLIVRTRETPLIPYLIIFISELILTFQWVLDRAYRWRPVTRTVYPERLPKDDHKFPPVDVFVCTADAGKEPSLGVMNTVISAMALDYPPDKIAVYLSDDGGSYVTRQAMKDACKFAKWWIPFCKKYEVKTRCPDAYFSGGADGSDDKMYDSAEFLAEKKDIKKRYNEFKKTLEKNSVNASSSVSRDHSPIIEVITDEKETEMPLLVYVAREKRPSKPHHFKAGALNTLIKVSALISNAPYMLVLDCDHYCNDPTSVRQAMCYYLDPEISPKLAFVQFPQHFHNIGPRDLYDGRLYYYWRKWLGMDGIAGPSISGCNLFLKREALYGKKNMKSDIDFDHSKKTFGLSNELIKSIRKSYKPELLKDGKLSDAVEKEVRLLASCAYDSTSEWGKEVGFIYFSVVEDNITSQFLHCQGYCSVWVDPPRPCFLGSCPTKLSDMLVQQARWGLGLMQISLGKFCPLWNGLGKMSYLQCMCYASGTFDPLFVVPFYSLAIIPQICVLHGIPLYPKVSDPFFIVFAFIFLSSQLKHVQEVMFYGDSFMTSVYELRVWMMKCASCYLYATLGAFMGKFGLHEANFTLTNKAGDDDDQVRLYEKGVYNFQASPLLIIPFCVLYILNVTSFVIGTARTVQSNRGSEMLAQVVLPLFGVIVNYHVLEGMVLRSDKGRISPSVSLVSAAITAAVLCFGSLVLIY